AGGGEPRNLRSDTLQPFDGAFGLWELDPERAALAGHALHADRAAHRLDEPLGEHEPQARPLHPTRLRAEPVEGLEEALLQGRREARSRVRHTDPEPAFVNRIAGHR